MDEDLLHKHGQYSDLNVPVKSVNADKAIRFGKKQSLKPRLLLVTVSESHLTPKEWEQHRKLREELKCRRESAEQNLIIRRGIIIVNKSKLSDRVTLNIFRKIFSETYPDPMSRETVQQSQLQWRAVNVSKTTQNAPATNPPRANAGDSN